MTVPPYSTGNYEDGARPARSVDAGRLWTGGLATALVAALVTLVGVMIARGLFDVPVLAPTDEGTLGNASTLRLAVFAAVAALLATGLLHLLLSTLQPRRFFTWIITLATLAAALVPFLTSADLDEKIATSAITLVGLAIGSSVGRRPQRHPHQPLGRPERGGGRGGEGGHGGELRVVGPGLGGFGVAPQPGRSWRRLIQTERMPARWAGTWSWKRLWATWRSSPRATPRSSRVRTRPRSGCRRACRPHVLGGDDGRGGHAAAGCWRRSRRGGRWTR